MNSPFKFLDAYTLNDKDVFFGRTKEVDALYAMVFETPIILLYGLSGTGKTSLIKCGLANRFSGPDWNPYFIRRNKNINDSLAAIIQKETPTFKGDADNLIGRLKLLYLNYFSPVYLIFDQFEELFILGTKEEQETFIETIKTILATDLNCKIILSMREEYLGNLYHFEKEVPYLFDFKLRVEKMNIDTVKNVLTASFEKFNIHLEAPEEKHIDQIIDNISQGKSGISLPYLQVYLDNLYKEDYARTYPGETRQHGKYPEIVFTAAEIKDFGDIDNVLEKFLIEQELEISQKFALKHPKLTANKIREIVTNFITEEGTKKPIRYEKQGDINILEKEFRDEFPNLTDIELLDCLKALETGRIVRFTDDTIELAHDSLAAVIHRIRDHEDLKLREVKNQLKVHYKTYLATKAHLNQKKLLFYEDYLPLLNLSSEILTFIQDSKTNLRKKKIIGGLKTIGTAILAIIILIIGTSWYKMEQQRTGMQAEMVEKEKGFVTRIQNLLGWKEEAKKITTSYKNLSTDRTSAFLDIKSTQDSLEAKKAIEEKLYQNLALYPFYANKLSFKTPFTRNEILPINDTLQLLFTLDETANQINLDSLDKHFYRLTDSQSFITNQSKITDYQVIKNNDSLQILTVAKNGNIQLWSVNNRQLENEIIDFGAEIYCLTPSANIHEFYIGTSKGIGLISLENFNRDPKILQVTNESVTEIKANKNTKIIAFTTTNKHQLNLLNRKIYYKKTGQFQVIPIFLKDKNIMDFDISEDGQLIAISYDDGQAGIWSIDQRRELQRLVGQQSIIQSIAFSPNQEFIVTGSIDGKAIIWNRGGEIIKRLLGHASPINRVKFINNALISTAVKEEDLKIWNITSLAEKEIPFTSAINQVAFLNDSINLIVSCRKQLGVLNHIDLDSNQIIPLVQRIQSNENKGYIQDFALIDSQQIVIGASNHLTSILHINTNEQLDLRQEGQIPNTSIISCLAVKDNLIAIGDHNRKMILLRRRDSLAWHSILFYSAKVYSMVFSPTEPYLFAGYDDGVIVKWNLETGLPVDTLEAHTDRVKTLKLFKIDQKNYLFSGSADNKAILWKANEQGQYEVNQTLMGHLQDVNAVDFSITKKMALTASGDKTVKLWDWKEGQLIENKKHSFIRHHGAINAATFSPDGKRIATGSTDKTLKIWNIDQIDKIIDKRVFKQPQ